MVLLITCATVLKNFVNYKFLNDNAHKVTIPDGRTILVKYIGDIILNNGVKLIDVLYIPDFKYNLIYVHKLTYANNSNISFSSNYCFI